MFQCKSSLGNSAISVQRQPNISADWHTASMQLYSGQGMGKLSNSAESVMKQGRISYKTACPKYLNEVGAMDQCMH